MAGFEGEVQERGEKEELVHPVPELQKVGALLEEELNGLNSQSKQLESNYSKERVAFPLMQSMYSK